MNQPKALRRFGAAIVAAALGAALVVNIAGAQSPPNPPSRFVGNVKIDGANAPAGTLIEARINGATCGVSTVFFANSEARYTLDSPALEPSANNCGVDGSVVEFYVAGKKANETGSWANYRLNTVNLTVTSATPAPTTPPATVTRTPAPPVAGTSADTASSQPPLTEILLVAAALGLAGVALAARTRKA